jgi:hypothetical protein
MAEPILIVGETWNGGYSGRVIVPAGTTVRRIEFIDGRIVVMGDVKRPGA